MAETPSMNVDFDEDALHAALELVGRTGAKGFEVGYLHDDVPVEDADWYAHAQFRGARVTTEHHRGPVEAAESLARRLLSGGLCTHCKRTIVLGGDGKRRCRWTRVARTWKRGCE